MSTTTKYTFIFIFPDGSIRSQHREAPTSRPMYMADKVLRVSSDGVVLIIKSRDENPDRIRDFPASPKLGVVPSIHGITFPQE